MMFGKASRLPLLALATAALTVALVGCGGTADLSSQGRAQSGASTTTSSTTAASSTAAPTTSTEAPTTTTTSPATPRRSTPRTAVPAMAASTTTTTEAPTTTAACPPNLAQSLRHTYGAGQLVTVESSVATTSYATVQLWQRSGNCWTSAGGPWSGRIGANGFSSHHVEGDNTTPVGVYGIGATMYGNQPNPGVRYGYHQLVWGDWWDEDPRSREYNTFQHVACGTAPPFGGGSEALWTETAAYPSFAVIDYNADPIAAGAGSGIFFHADTGSATAGCVSVPIGDLDRALDWLNPGLHPLFVMGPADLIRGL